MELAQLKQAEQEKQKMMAGGAMEQKEERQRGVGELGGEEKIPRALHLPVREVDGAGFHQLLAAGEGGVTRTTTVMTTTVNLTGIIIVIQAEAREPISCMIMLQMTLLFLVMLVLNKSQRVHYLEMIHQLHQMWICLIAVGFIQVVIG